MISFATNSHALTLTLNPSTIGCGTTTINGTFDCSFNGTVVVSVSGGVELDAASPSITVAGGVMSFDLIVEATDALSFTFSGVVIASNLPCAAVNTNFSTAMTHTCILPPNDECANAKALPIDYLACGGFTLTDTDNTSDSGTPPSCGGAGYVDLWYEFVSNGSSVTIEMDEFPGNLAFVALYEGTCGGTQVACGLLSIYGSKDLPVGGLTAGTTYKVQVLHIPGESGPEQEICAFNNVVVALDNNELEVKYEEGKVDLIWEDHSKTGQQYEIYRSAADELYFEKIGDQHAEGKEGYAQYRYSDSNVEFGISYVYKVIKLNEDGGVMYEAQRSIYIDDPELLDENSMKIYPNPSMGQVNMFVNSSQREVANIEVVDLQGRVLHAFNYHLALGENNIEFMLTDLPIGLYTVRMRTSSFQQSQKLIKK